MRVGHWGVDYARGKGWEDMYGPEELILQKKKG